MISKNLKGSGIIILIIILAAALLFIFYNSNSEEVTFIPFLKIREIIRGRNVKIEKFKSEDDFKKYLEENGTESQYALYGSSGMRNAEAMLKTESMMASTMDMNEADGMVSGLGSGESADRVSETNTQVLSIDEPDIVKTDGENIFYNYSKYYYGYRSSNLGSYYNRNAEIKIIKAFPPAKLAEIGEIEQGGDLFLSDNNLVIFSGKNIYAYDVSNPEKPLEKWEIELEDNSYLMEARLYKGDIYLVTRNYINHNNPCPIRPLSVNGSNLEVNCVDIYYPNIAIDADSTFVALKIDAQSGEIKDQTSFVGSANSSVTYMSANALYITYFYNENSLDFFAGFLSEECSDLVSTELISKLSNLRNYDISNQAKMTELQVLLERFYNGLDSDERLRIENEFSNRMEKYHQEHIRELERTGIVKIGLENFKLEANGEVPGYPLNQFSLDEYDGNLRIATTIGERTGSPYWIGRGDTLNDVYVLDNNLSIKGSVQNLGETERVYSVRFVGDRGYVVTFRQIDPFYVLDLSNSRKPELKGELKIPGYSSYLHPVKENIILGIGKEGSKVKLSLFDVTDPTDPQEISKYMLDEYWSEAVNNHHAFLLDKKHEVFFIPGGKGAYIFSYENNKLSLTKALSKTGIQRALYLDDYLYIIGNEEISVINENDWTEVNNMDFDGFNNPEPVLDEIKVFAE